VNDRDFLHLQSTQLQRLLESAQGDPVLVPQLQERLAEMEQKLQELQGGDVRLFEPPVTLPDRTALFLRGESVPDQEGIDPSLAGELLLHYNKMFCEQALHNEQQFARRQGRQRRRRGTPQPRLLLTSTPRGSFGLEFRPAPSEEGEVSPLHSEALTDLHDLLQKMGSETGSLESLVEEIAPRLLPPLQNFLRTLAEHRVELRMVSTSRPSTRLSFASVVQAAEQLSRDWLVEEKVVLGTFRGVTRESGWFDLLTLEKKLITGVVADDLTEEDFDRIDALTNSLCQATLQQTTIRTVGRGEQSKYLLLDARKPPT